MSGYQSTEEGASVSGSTAVPGRVDGLTMRSQWNQHSKSTSHHTTTTTTEKSPAVSAAHRGTRSGRAATFLRQTAASMALNIGSSGSLPSPTRGSYQSGNGAQNPAQRRRRANLLRVWIERGLMVGMGLLAGYRMMTLTYNHEPLHDARPSSGSPLSPSEGSWNPAHEQVHKDVIPTLSRNAWAIGAGLVLLTLVHVLFLTAHDHRLQFPLYNKNQPLQPVQKRSSRYLNMNAPEAVAAAAVVADSDDDSEDDEAIQRERAAELQENLQLLNQESAQGASGNGAAATGSGGGSVMEPVLGSLQSRFCRSAEGAMPQWRVWGSEAHWYRKGADNGSIFATVLVPVVLAAKFVQTVTDEKFLSTAADGVQTAESVLSSLALSLTFGASILVHMLLLKVFEDHAGHGSKVKPAHMRKDSGSRSTILDSITLPPSIMPSTTPSSSMSTNNLHASTGSGEFLYPKYLSPSHRQRNISSPSSPSSPSLSATSSAVSSTVLHHHQQQEQQQEQLRQQQQLQEAFMFSTDQMHHPSLLMGSSEAEKSSDREEIWIIALGFGGAYTCLVTLLARFKWIPGLEMTGAGMVMLNQNVFQMLMIGFAYFYRRSFTFGELVVLAQAVTLLVNETLTANFITTPPAPGTVLENPQFLFLLTLVVGMLLIGVLLTPVLMYCRRLAQMPIKGASPASLQKREFKKKVSAGVVYAGLLGIVLGLIMPRCERLLGQNPFLWLIEFMLMNPGLFSGQIAGTSGSSSNSSGGAHPGQSPATIISSLTGEGKFDLQTLMKVRIGWSRLGLCLYWILAVSFSIGFFYWMNASIRRRTIIAALNNRRKFYHALAVLMFIPGYLTDEPFIHIAFSVALSSLIFLEYLRYFAVAPLGKEIHLFLVGFLDDRDGGPIILSHLYLLMGCAVPVWLAEHHILAGLSGIFALGVGDAMASIVGKRFGRHRWPGTIKTVEGTLAFVVSVMIAAGAVFVGMWLMSFIFGDSSLSFMYSSSSRALAAAATTTMPPQSAPSTLPPASLLSFSTWNDWSSVTWSVWGVVRYGVAVSVAAMLEAVSEQNDNLVIPVVMLSMVWLI
ncbi:hypothetical protein KVV02_004425 [Mortierella alpina]|uniref:dolichol kinase n=1 Tax=Mortierella alpina TaxID=64518 RepID=A0A9P8A7T8_MORAP|nr:hypothetical protein KVV02_004425 [Mortierella alpina]